MKVSVSIKILFLNVFLWFNVGNGFSQNVPELKDITICLQEGIVTIASECEDCNVAICGRYLVYVNSEYSESINTYQTVKTSDNEVVLFEMVKHNRDFLSNQKEYYQNTILNTTTGKYLIDFGPHAIQYIQEDDLYIVNRKGEGVLLDCQGTQISKNSYDNIGYIQGLGYYNKGFYESKEEVFDKNENIILTLSDYQITEGIDAATFIAVPTGDNVEIVDGYYIINKEEKVLFYDELGFIYMQKDSMGNNNVLGHGLAGTVDSYSLLIERKKGQWYNPILQFQKTHYVDYIATFQSQVEQGKPMIKHSKKKVLCYVIGADLEFWDRKGYFLDTKGHVIIELEDAPRFKSVVFKQNQDKKAYPFIYTYDQLDSDKFSVYDENGKIILAHSEHIENPMPSEITKAGYYSFMNVSQNETYLYHTNTKKLVTLSGMVKFTNLSEVEKHF